MTSLFRSIAASVLITLASAWPLRADEPPTFIGVPACAGCHAPELDAWKGSHHALAMQPVTVATVLGNFAGTRTPCGAA